MLLLTDASQSSSFSVCVKYNCNIIYFKTNTLVTYAIV